MKKDKQRDLIRAILPSTGRKSARDDSRHIHRRTRHNARQALNQISEEDDYDDSIFFEKTNKSEKRHKADMRSRVSRRRGGDKLGPIKRFTEKVKRESANDSEARQKIAEVIQPGKNLITEHAMTHVDWWLDCPKAGYYLPEENERDIKAHKNRNRIGMRKRRGKIVWGKRRFKRIIKRLIEIEHTKLNKALKESGLTFRECKVDRDQCLTEYTKKVVYYEIFDPQSWYKWRKISRHLYDQYERLGRRVRRREEIKEMTHHDLRLCQNRVIAQEIGDYLKIAKALLTWNQAIYESDFGKPKYWERFNRGTALKRIKELADKHDL